MKKLILSVAVAASLYSTLSLASDDENEHTTVVSTTPATTNNLSGVNTNTVDNSNTLSSTNRLVNHNNTLVNNSNANNNRNDNVNTLGQNQTQVQDQLQSQDQHQVANGGYSVATSQGGNATASGNGSGNSTTINQSYSDVYRDRLQVSSAYAANLTSGADTCLGSVSGAVQTQLLGVSGGKTVVDENCVKIKNDKLRMEKALFAYHAPGIGPVVACYILTQDPDFSNAMKMAGVECREPQPVVVPPTVEDVPVPSDPATKSAELIRNQYK